MKQIKYIDYFPSMGTLIDLNDPITFKERNISGSKNIPYQKLMLHYNEYLKKEEPYYLLCTKGMHSKRAATILEYYGYNVTQVTIDS